MNIFIELKQIKDLPPSERQAVNYILENPNEVVGMGIVKLAQKAYTSTGSIMRVCKKMNMSSFRDFRLRLASDVGDYIHSAMVFTKQESVDREDSLEQIIEKVSSNNARSIIDFRMLNSQQTVSKIVELMSVAKVIDFYGSGLSNLICVDAQMKAMRLGIVSTAYSYYSQMAINARTSDKSHLAFLVSYTGQTTEVISIANVLRGLDVPSVSITANTNNALLELCDINLFVSSIESVYRIGGMSSRISTLNALDVLYTAYINANYETLQDTISKTFINEVFYTAPR